ncbi:MAG: hypothetical protein LBG77_01755 [Dysgonamonadaceae bacterium]|jgi:hypothetical protein|nr:hypothetical protein [Dysgonamonadaceae bacterium]
MALQREIWINSIIEGLFADNTFASKSTDHSGFVNAKTVHVPNAGTYPAVVKVRPNSTTTTPGQATKNPGKVDDVDLQYSIESYFVGPLVIPNAEVVELSYDKRNSVLFNIRAALADAIHGDLIYKWIPAGGVTIATSGATGGYLVTGATGARNKLVKGDVLKIRTIFDSQNMPQVGRNLMVDANMYGELLESLTDTEAAAFLATANAATGQIGKLYGFDVFLRSQVAKATAAGAAKLFSAANAAADCAAGIAWSSVAVSRATGNAEIFDNPGNAMYFGDVLSGEIRAGGSFMRNDKKGVVLVYQGTPA